MTPETKCKCLKFFVNSPRNRREDDIVEVPQWVKEHSLNEASHNQEKVEIFMLYDVIV